MDELLQKLFESELLTPDMQAEIKVSFEAKMAELTEQVREQESTKVRAELVEQWLSERETLVEAIDAKVEDLLATQLDELKEDIARFRDLEAEKAAEIVEMRATMAAELQSDITALIVELDSFVDARLTHEISELKEDLAIANQNNFGRKIMEAFKDEFVTSFYDENSIQSKLDETAHQLETIEAKYARVLQENKKLKHDGILESLLAPLSGTKRDVMETLLSKVPTDKLNETYEKFIGRVLTETPNTIPQEKESKVLSETVITTERKEINVAIRTGDTAETVELTEGTSSLDSDIVAQLRRLSGQV